MEQAIQKADILIEALPYIQAFRNKIVVIKFGGSAMDKEDVLDRVLLDIVFLKAVGIEPILVHGGGPFITKEMARIGKRPSFVEGHRVTDKETLEIVKDITINKVSRPIVGKINKAGGDALCVWDMERPPLLAEKYLLKKDCGTSNETPIDLGYVGQITHVDAVAFHSLCDNGKIPVIPPIARGVNGNTYNINADSMACLIAQSLKAEKLVFLSNTHGIMTDPHNGNSLASTLHERDINFLIEQDIISGGMLPKVRACISALTKGVKKAHIIDGRIPHSLLLEIFTDKGIGTQILI